MINYRVRDLKAFLDQLKADGIEIEKTEDFDYGRFAWIKDPEGNKIELVPTSQLGLTTSTAETTFRFLEQRRPTNGKPSRRARSVPTARWRRARRSAAISRRRPA